MRVPRLKPESDQLLHVDLLRLAACLLVVFHHIWPHFVPADERAAFAVRHVGWYVIIEQFFAVSGFVIAMVYSERVGTLAAYLKYMQRRVARVYPLHLWTLAATAASLALASWAGHRIDTDFDLSPQCLASQVALAHVHAFCDGATLNYPNWTVSVEMALYLIFPLIVMLRRMMLLIGTAGVAWMYFSYAGGPMGIADLGPAVRGLISFSFGAGLFFGRCYLTTIPAPRALLAGFSAVYVGALFINASTLFLMPLGYAVLILAIAADQRGQASAWVRSLAGYGQLTYSIYMIHALVITIVVGGISVGLLGLSGAALALVVPIIYAVTIALSYASYVAFEVPARRWIGLGRDRSRRPVAQTANPLVAVTRPG